MRNLITTLVLCSLALIESARAANDGHMREKDKEEALGVVEFVLQKADEFTAEHHAKMIFNQSRPTSVAEIEGEHLRFRFSPRDAKTWSYVIKSNFSELEGQSGKFVAQLPSLEKTKRPSETNPNWWIDDPKPLAAVRAHSGAKSVSQGREAYLRDFANRLDRCMSKPSRN